MKINIATLFPEMCEAVLSESTIHTLSAGEQAILYRLRTMTDDEFEALPYGSEGLWRKLMHNARNYATLEEILSATKSKRYTRTRLDRMVMCAILGLENVTAIVVTHTLEEGLLKQYDGILTFKNGEIIEAGTFEELIAKKGYFYSLFTISQ